MANRSVIDPITRIEGHLRVEIEVRDGAVADAYSFGTMVRGLEIILKGRDPRDAWVFAQRTLRRVHDGACPGLGANRGGRAGHRGAPPMPI